MFLWSLSENSSSVFFLVIWHFLKICFYFLCMNILPACVRHRTPSEECVRPPGTGVMDSCEPPWRCWKSSKYSQPLSRLCSCWVKQPGCPRTHSVDQTVLKRTDIRLPLPPSSRILAFVFGEKTQNIPAPLLSPTAFQNCLLESRVQNIYS